ncbi:MAG: TetR/AcrR family transcriptional regulator [Pseudomonadota bacterium]
MRADDTADRVLDAAEARFRRYGFHGTSFRDLAGDVGIKSASVHHHFPTKADLGRAVADRYAQRFLEALGDPRDPSRTRDAKIARLVRGFREALQADNVMCLCGVLATESDGLPAKVTSSVATFFRLTIQWTETALGGGDEAAAEARRLVALLEGAMMLASVLDDASVFEAAVRELPSATS